METEQKKKSPAIGIVVAVVVVLLLAVGGFYFLNKNKGQTDKTTEEIINEQTGIDQIETTVVGSGKFARDLLRDQYMMEVEMNEGGMTVAMTYAKSGDSFYIAVPTFGMKNLTLADRSCSINDESKTYFCSTMEEDETDLFDADDLAYLNQAPILGTETIEGTVYETETYADDLVGFYDGDTLRYYRIGEDPTIIRVLNYTADAPSDLFVIPAGYTETETLVENNVSVDLTQMEGMEDIDPALLEELMAE